MSNLQNINPKHLEKVLFLDFDGVLNNAEEAHNSQLNDLKVNRLTTFCVENNISIVFSTNWRNIAPHNTPELLKKLLLEHLGHEQVNCIGQLENFHLLFKTDYSTLITQKPHRGFEIQDWLETHKPEKYVIVDDYPRILLQDPNIVLTDGWYGLHGEDYKTIQNLFAEQAPFSYNNSPNKALLKALKAGDSNCWSRENLLLDAPVIA